MSLFSDFFTLKSMLFYFIKSNVWVTDNDLSPLDYYKRYTFHVHVQCTADVYMHLYMFSVMFVKPLLIIVSTG